MSDEKIDTRSADPDNQSHLVEHARRELALIGEDQWITDGLCRVVAAFADMGHSGFSAAHCADVLNRLLRYEPLSPLTDDADEWQDRSAEMDGKPFWQNRRDSRAMSTDGGKTYWRLDECDAAGSMETTPIHRTTPKVDASGEPDAVDAEGSEAA